MKTIVLNGISWDTENIAVEGKTYFMYKEALQIANDSGKRLPTKKEFEELLKLPHVFDEDKRGMWFAEKTDELKTERSLFLPAAGCRYGGSETILDFFRFCYYWSATPVGTTYAYYLCFIDDNAGMAKSNQSNGLTVRCVSE